MGILELENSCSVIFHSDEYHNGSVQCSIFQNRRRTSRVGNPTDCSFLDHNFFQYLVAPFRCAKSLDYYLRIDSINPIVIVGKEIVDLPAGRF